MGFLSKVKDILFDDAEDTVDEKKVQPKKEVKEEKIAERIEPQKRVEEPPKNVEVVEPPKVNSTPNYDHINERDLYKAENTFSFPDFDEEEFSSSVSRVQKPKSSTNVLEYEKKRKTEKRYDFGKYERIETKEVVEKKKFKPSPIISPVYGILNEDYKIEDIMDKTEENRESNLDFNSVRKKAFGDVEKLEDKKPDSEYYEETVTVKLREDPEEKKEKVKTIDELLEETSDLIMDVKEEDEVPVSDYENVDTELEEITQPKEEKPADPIDEEDTLENDLFDLIDSMYDSREDGEL